MSQFATSLDYFARLSDASIGLLLIAKLTAVLALAWLAHGMLAGRNPRWRVTLWRSAIVGLAVVTGVSAGPSVVTYQSVVPESPAVEVALPVPTASAIVEREPMVPIHPAIAATTVTIRRDEPAPAPASAEAQSFRWRSGLVSWFWSIWLAGVFVLTLRLMLGSLGLARVIRRSSAVSDGIVRECRTIADRLACRRAVQIRRTPQVATPCLAGLWRPVLLLPDRECEVARPDELRAILAHELAHARNQDLAWNLVAHIASILLWFHPLAWRIRVAHAAACDAVCDAVAADLLGDVASYGRTLARLAVRAAWPSSVHGLGMARSSDVRRRLDALNRKVFRTRLSPMHVMPALSAGSVLLVLIGGFGFTRAEQSAAPLEAGDTAKPADQNTARELTLRAVAAETGQPIAGLTIAFEGIFGDQPRKGSVQTGTDGTATIAYSSGSRVKSLGITVSMPKRVPIFIHWDRSGQPVHLPASRELRLALGTVIGGIVTDEAGKPIAGATIIRSMPLTEWEGSWMEWRIDGPKTDDQGRWRMDDAPANLADVSVEVGHPNYHTNAGPVSRNLDSVVVLKKGYTVTGRIVDASGRPVRGARAVIGRSYSAGTMPAGTTNASGEFALERCAEGPNIVTVQADGLAPELRDVRVGDRLEPLVFRLQPGSELRLRVIDVQGKPVAGAFVFPQTWRGYHSIDLRSETDSEGRLTWRSAPPDIVLYDIGKTGFMSCRAFPLIASEREQVVTLRPKLMITGRVTDAATGRPLPKCLIIEGVGFLGSDQISWSRASASAVSGGEYTAPFEEPNHAMYVRVEALGYKPAVSRAFRPEEGGQRFDVALERAETLSGIVQLPDGKPADGVDVVLATDADQVLFQSGRLESRTTAPRAKTGPDGRFAFTVPKDDFLLIAIGEAGYADASPADFAKSEKIILQPWGRLEGEVMAGRRPKANEEISFSPSRPRGEFQHVVFIHQYDTKTDDHGRFVFDRVIPGSGLVTRPIVTNFGRFSQRLASGGEAVDIQPGRTTMVHIGGNGRPVLGQVVLDGTPDRPIEWTHNPPAMMTRLKDQADNLASGNVSLGSNFDKDGRFRIDNVTPGIYTLGFSINAKPNPEAFERGEVIGLVQMSVSVPAVPAGESDKPLELGTITAKLFERLEVGDLAPEFVIPRIAGKGKGDQLRLADYRGQLVLVDFWATWCGPCLAEMPGLKDIQKTFGADPRFALISLACDQKDEAAKQYIRENGLMWTHGYAGDLSTGAGLSYKVRSIPATFLIGPDGRVLAKNLRGGELKDAIRVALLADERSRK
jgi:beta-lactamase regulating signal transducer with metallopeptidase domain/thiol-disulfide isomerase/thioredoxin